MFSHRWQHYRIALPLRNVVPAGPPSTCTFTIGLLFLMSFQLMRRPLRIRGNHHLCTRICWWRPRSRSASCPDMPRRSPAPSPAGNCRERSADSARCDGRKTRQDGIGLVGNKRRFESQDDICLVGSNGGLEVRTTSV